jgi:NADH-quinone oxidoreductase subunit N
MPTATEQLWSDVDVWRDLALFSPLIAMTCTMLGVVFCPIVIGRGARTIATVAVIGLSVTFLLSLWVAGQVAAGGSSGLSTLPNSGILIVDSVSVGFQLIVVLFAFGVLGLWWIGSAATERDAPEFFILLLGSAFGMMLMTSTTNLLMIVVAIETASLPSFAIVGFNKRDARGAEASLKYMVFGAISTALMLYGASLLYGVSGSVHVADVAAASASLLGAEGIPLILATGLLCFLGGIAFKISAVPFHFWCPDAFEGAQIEVTTWLSVVSKAAGLLLLARLVGVFCHVIGQSTPQEGLGITAPLSWTIGMMAAVTCTVGNFAAYRQQSVKRLLAYSSIAHAGYMMMAAAVFLHPATSGSTAPISALLVYVFIYMFMNLGAFGITALVSWSRGSDDIHSFTGLARSAPWLAVPMVICLISLVGLPPFAGFIAKWWLLVALGSVTGSSLGWVLVVVAVLNTLVSLFYYLRIVVQMTLREEEAQPLRVSPFGVALVNVCGVMLLVLFVFAQPVKRTADRAAAGVFRPQPIAFARDDSSAPNALASTATSAVAPPTTDASATSPKVTEP